MLTDAVNVIVAERDSEWQGWANQLGSSCLRVIAQRPSESASTFAARVRGEVGRIEGRVSQAVLVAGQACDPELLAARALIVRAITKPMSRRGRLVLDGQRKNRYAMEALAQIVSAQLTGVTITTEAAPAVAPAAAPVSAPAPAMPVALPLAA